MWWIKVFHISFRSQCICFFLIVLCLIRSQHMALYKRVLIDWLIDCRYSLLASTRQIRNFRMSIIISVLRFHSFVCSSILFLSFLEILSFTIYCSVMQLAVRQILPCKNKMAILYQSKALTPMAFIWYIPHFNQMLLFMSFTQIITTTITTVATISLNANNNNNKNITVL